MYKAIATVYPTDDVVIADITATEKPYSADKTGISDSTDAIQKALDECAKNGGGTVYLPAGHYKITGSVTVPAFVTLRGDWQNPDAGNGYGTLILACVMSSDKNLPALFNLKGSGGVLGLTVYYPQQDIYAVKPYPYVFYVDGLGDGYMLQTIMNCTVINGYNGIAVCTDTGNAHEMLTVENFYGTFLNNAAEVYNQADVGTWKNLHISASYWADAGDEYNAPSREDIIKYTKAKCTALVLGDLEWTEFLNISVSDCMTAIHIVKGKRIEFAGSLYDVNISNCGSGIIIDSIDERWGMILASGSIAGDEYSIINNTKGTVKLTGVTLTGKYTNIDDTDIDISLDGVSPDYNRIYKKPSGNVFSTQFEKNTDIGEILQTVLNQAGNTGGVVYIPAGIYYIGSPVTVPAHTELRGSSSVAQRDQSGSSGGTIFFIKCGITPENPDTDTAAVTLGGENAGINGIRLIYPDNSPYVNAVTAYVIRGHGAGVYAVNCCIAAAYNGIDFRGCDNHYIKKLVSCCYNNAIAVGDCTGGYIEGCLQNGTVLTRNGLKLNKQLADADVFPLLFDKITRKNTDFIKAVNAVNETVTNTFAYGVKTLVKSENSENLLLINVGADNIGNSSALLMTDGGTVTGINIMRYNGIWYLSDRTKLSLYNLISIGQPAPGAVLPNKE